MVLVVVVAVALGTGFALRTRQHSTTTRDPSSQLASVQSGCDDWQITADSLPNDWFSGMVSWMGERMGSAMMGSRMLAGPDQLRTSCRHWVADNPNESGNSTASTCDDMVTWMNKHAEGGWGTWPMHDH